MPAKRTNSSTATKRRGGQRSKVLYPALAQGPTPAERRKELEKRMRRRGLTLIANFERYLEEVSDFWPQDETCDEFLVWLRKLRQESR
jgi:hypothetical protein